MMDWRKTGKRSKAQKVEEESSEDHPELADLPPEPAGETRTIVPAATPDQVTVECCGKEVDPKVANYIDAQSPKGSKRWWLCKNRECYNKVQIKISSHHDESPSS